MGIEHRSMQFCLMLKGIPELLPFNIKVPKVIERIFPSDNAWTVCFSISTCASGFVVAYKILIS